MKTVPRVALFALCVLLSPATWAADKVGPDLSFLLGDWSGTGSGDPGQGAGSFSFASDLQNQILVRRSHSEYPAAGGRPATVHDDLLIVHAGQSRAIYFDNEGHVIHYDVKVDGDGKGATFVSTDPSPSPLFRLTYRQRSADELTVAFEISMSRKPEDLKPYLSGVVKRTAASRQ